MGYSELRSTTAAIQDEDPWEDEFEEEQDNGDQTEHSDGGKSSLPYDTPSLITHNFVLTMQTWMLILRRATKKLRPHSY